MKVGSPRNGAPIADCQRRKNSAEQRHEHRRNSFEIGGFVREQKWWEAINCLYADDIVSVEAQEIGKMPAEMRGLDKVRGKTQWFLETSQIHGCTIGGPFVARDKFVVQLDVDVTDKASEKRAKMSELGIYTVKEGKIVREEFLPNVASEG